MTPLSVVIITKNEEKTIGACIDAVSDIADEIVVLDSFSTDKTEQICREKGARFEQNAFDGHIEQKNRAKNLATHNWVLSLDADEKPDSMLLQNIKTLKENDFPGNISGYSMNRLNFYCRKPVKSCGWYPDTKLRLWKKDCGAWTGINPHDRFELNEGMVSVYLQGDILHNTYPTHADMVRQVNKFAGIAAQQFSQKPLLWLISKMLFSPIFKYTKNYLIKQGFMDGKAGFQICRYQAIEVFRKYRLAITLKYSLYEPDFQP
ncbi:MAG: glycosyltransferase family 2 protein [Bacteroidetes bacterium]|nr:glycosyltransferase family 2 protein [Bacteroidota bacterium]